MVDTKKCSDIDILQEETGSWKYNGYKEGSIATLTCKDGYELDGPNSTMKCGADGMWENDGDFPFCKPIGELLDDDNVYNLLDSPCRNSTNMFSYYMTELNGINVIVKLIIIGLYFKKYKKKSIFINGLIIILAIHTFIHILIILASLPPFCDSSNMNWKKGYIFNYIDCHWKYELYYSLPFWFIDNIVPGIVAIYLLF